MTLSKSQRHMLKGMNKACPIEVSVNRDYGDGLSFEDLRTLSECIAAGWVEETDRDNVTRLFDITPAGQEALKEQDEAE